MGTALEAQVTHPWYISIWGREGRSTTPASSAGASSWAVTSRRDWNCSTTPARNPTNGSRLLQQAQEIARDVGRPIATHEEARARTSSS